MRCCCSSQGRSGPSDARQLEASVTVLLRAMQAPSRSRLESPRAKKLLWSKALDTGAWGLKEGRPAVKQLSLKSLRGNAVAGK